MFVCVLLSYECKRRTLQILMDCFANNLTLIKLDVLTSGLFVRMSLCF